MASLDFDEIHRTRMKVGFLAIAGWMLKGSQVLLTLQARMRVAYSRLAQLLASEILQDEAL
jgi:hypothetical protein